MNFGRYSKKTEYRLVAGSSTALRNEYHLKVAKGGVKENPGE